MAKHNHEFYSIHLGILHRCCNPKHSQYWMYGGQGIVFHKEWLEDIDAFAAYMGPRPSPQHTVDRFPDKFGSYVPGNVRWATPKEQAQNRRPRMRKMPEIAPSTPEDKQAFQGLISRYTKTKIGQMVGISKQAVGKWETVPLKYVTVLHQKTGIPKAHLRPSDFA